MAERKRRIEERDEKIRKARIKRRREIEEAQDIIVKIFVILGIIGVGSVMLFLSI